MLQEFWDKPNETLGTGASVCFMCEDALTLYREFKLRGSPGDVEIISKACGVDSK